MMPFSKEEVLELIKLVEKNPIIYKNCHLNIGSEKKETAWRNIAKELDKPVSECKSRWLNIRDNMRRKIRLRERDPNCAKHQSKYKYEDDLTFILPHFRGITYDVEYLEDFEDSVDESSSALHNTEEIYLGIEEDVEDLEEVKPSVSSINLNNSAVSTSSTAQDGSKDSTDVFLDAVGSTLRNLSPYYLTLAKSKIFQAAQECELQQIVNKGEHPLALDRLKTQDDFE